MSWPPEACRPPWPRQHNVPEVPRTRPCEIRHLSDVGPYLRRRILRHQMDQPQERIMSTLTFFYTNVETERRLEGYRHSQAGRVGSLLRAARYRRAHAG